MATRNPLPRIMLVKCRTKVALTHQVSLPSRPSHAAHSRVTGAIPGLRVEKPWSTGSPVLEIRPPGAVRWAPSPSCPYVLQMTEARVSESAEQRCQVQPSGRTGTGAGRDDGHGGGGRGDRSGDWHSGGGARSAVRALFPRQQRRQSGQRLWYRAAYCAGDCAAARRTHRGHQHEGQGSTFRVILPRLPGTGVP